MLEPITPPSDEAAEMAVLGSVLLDPVVLEDIPPLPADAFYWGKHQALWRVVMDLWQRGEPPDALLVHRELERTGRLEQAGGRAYCATLAAAVTSPAHARHYAAIVAEKSAARGLLRVARVLEQEVGEGRGAAECHRNAQEALYALSSLGAPTEPSPLSDAVYAVLGRLEGSQPGGLVVATGFHQLDDLLAGGLHGGQMTVLAARPSMGKTTLALNIGHNAAVAGRKVLVYSLEMTKDALAGNLLSSASGLPSDRLRKGRKVLGQAGMEQAAEAGGRLGNLPIWLSDDASVDASKIRSEAMRLKAREGLDLLIVDYLQLMGGDGAESRQNEVGGISRALKVLAKDLGIPLLALSQLNRLVEQREGHRPRLADLRESGAIEQDADVVAFVHRPSYHDKTADRNLAEIIVAKNRHGPTDTVRLVFQAETVTFKNPTIGDLS